MDRWDAFSSEELREIEYALWHGRTVGQFIDSQTADSLRLQVSKAMAKPPKARRSWWQRAKEALFG